MSVDRSRIVHPLSALMEALCSEVSFFEWKYVINFAMFSVLCFFGRLCLYHLLFLVNRVFSFMPLDGIVWALSLQTWIFNSVRLSLCFSNLLCQTSKSVLEVHMYLKHWIFIVNFDIVLWVVLFRYCRVFLFCLNPKYLFF